MIWTGTLPLLLPPRTIPSTTLRSNFQPGDTGEAQFSNLFFLLVGTVVRWRVGYHRFQRGSWERTATLVLFGWSCIPGCTPSSPPSRRRPDLSSPVLHPPLLSPLSPLSSPPCARQPARPAAPVTPPHKRITWVPERGKRGSMARGR